VLYDINWISSDAFEFKKKIPKNSKISKKPSFLKPLSQMSRNLVGNIYGRFSINANFGSIRLQTWPPQAILVFDWSMSKKSPTLKPLSQMNQRIGTK
jgi:hypothetical protein